MEKVYIVGPRPQEAPEGWTIWNAPRPLYGAKSWSGDFITGCFYAAQDPNDPDPLVDYEEIVRLNKRDNARELVYLSQAEFNQIFDAWLIPWSEKFNVDLSEFDQDWLIETFVDNADERYLLVK